MDPLIIGILCFVLILVLIGVGIPVAYSLLLIGFIGMVVIAGWTPTIVTLPTFLYHVTHKYLWTCIPLFILAGHLALYSGIAEDFFDFAYKWVGRLPGGLAIATVVGCGGFACCSGSSAAGAVTMGKISIGPMRNHGYSLRLATGSIAAGGPLSALIPPSLALIMYGVLTETSIGALFMAGYIPGIIEVAMFSLMIYAVCSWKPGMGPPAKGLSWRESFASVPKVWGVLMLAGILAGGIYTGIFTPTEAGAACAFSAFCMGIATRRLNWYYLKRSLIETSESTVIIFVILIGAYLYVRLMALSMLPQVLVQTIGGLNWPPLAIIGIFVIVLVFLGCFLEGAAMLVLVIPIMFPVAIDLGFHPVWFGILLAKMIEMGNITPPMGLTVYMIKSVAPDVPLEEVFRGVVMFFFVDCILVALLVLFPIMALWLPSTMMR